MSLRQTNALLSETVEGLNERAGATRVFVLVEPGYIALAGRTVDDVEKGISYYHDMWTIFELDNVPKELARKIKSRGGDAMKQWRSVKRYVKRAVRWGEGLDSAKDAMKFHRVYK